MAKFLLTSLFTFMATVACVATHAETPATPPDGMAFDIPYGPPINLETAKKLVAAVEAKATRHRWKLNIAVVDPNGDLVHFSRMDGAQLGSIGISQGKARTAARYRRDTRFFFNAFESGRTFIGTLDPTIVASAGGLPLIKEGKLIGAIGCSGANGDQDDAACMAAVDLIKQ